MDELAYACFQQALRLNPNSAKINRQINAVTETIRKYWIWLSIIGFILAWWIYAFNPLYFFQQYKIASDDSAAKMAANAHKKSVLKYYLKLGNALLNADKSKDAAKAFTEAKKIDPFNLAAEYRLRKTSLLEFSEEKQFDPVVVWARFGEVEALAPVGFNAAEDPHILYAKALFFWRTAFHRNKAEVKKLLVKVKPEVSGHSAASALLGEIALQEEKFDIAIESLEKALQLSPHCWETINNLAYAYQRRAETYLYRKENDKGGKIL